jgi:hypothetical protein
MGNTVKIMQASGSPTTPCWVSWKPGNVRTNGACPLRMWPVPFWGKGEGYILRSGDGCMFEMGRKKRSPFTRDLFLSLLISDWKREKRH